MHLTSLFAAANIGVGPGVLDLIHPECLDLSLPRIFLRWACFHPRHQYCILVHLGNWEFVHHNSMQGCFGNDIVFGVSTAAWLIWGAVHALHRNHNAGADAVLRSDCTLSLFASMKVLRTAEPTASIRTSESHGFSDAASWAAAASAVAATRAVTCRASMSCEGSELQKQCE